MLDYKKLDASFVYATKPLVDKLLSLNTKNRSLRKSHVDWIKEAIMRDGFFATGQAVAVSKTGVLLDGQHRLNAIRQAGYPMVQFILATGLEDESIMYVDQNLRRSGSDMLKLVLDKKITPRIVAIANFSLKLIDGDNGFHHDARKINLEDLAAVIDEDYEIISSICSAAGMLAKAGTACAIYHYAVRYGHENAIQFAKQVGTGEELSRNDPAFKLRNRLITTKTSGGVAQIDDYKFALTACIAHRDGRKLEVLKPTAKWP